VGYSHNNKEDRDMNEQLQTTVNEILQKSISAFEQGAEWMAGEIPDVVEQLLKWHMMEAVIYLTISLMFFTISVVAINNLRKGWSDSKSWVWDSYGMISIPAFLVCMLASIALAVSFVEIISNTLLIAKISIAPKLYLLEYTSSLIK
jgi:hypothetical protein